MNRVGNLSLVTLLSIGAIPAGDEFTCRTQKVENVDPGLAEIAQQTGGMILGPGDMAAVSKHSDMLIAPDGSDSSTLFRFVGEARRHVVAVDPVVGVLTARVQGMQAIELRLVRPDGRTVREGDVGVELTPYRSGCIVAVSEAEPGDWLLELAGEGDVSVEVIGRRASQPAARSFEGLDVVEEFYAVARAEIDTDEREKTFAFIGALPAAEFDQLMTELALDPDLRYREIAIIALTASVDLDLQRADRAREIAVGLILDGGDTGGLMFVLGHAATATSVRMWADLVSYLVDHRSELDSRHVDDFLCGHAGRPAGCTIDEEVMVQLQGFVDALRAELDPGTPPAEAQAHRP